MNTVQLSEDIYNLTVEINHKITRLPNGNPYVGIIAEFDYGKVSFRLFDSKEYLGKGFTYTKGYQFLLGVASGIYLSEMAVSEG